MKIFLLEDDAVLGEILVDHLKSKGYEVTHADDGLVAEEILLNEKFDIFILDVNTPGIDGFELLEGIRQTGSTTPAIFLTARSSSKDLKKGFDLGADDYIRKPFEFEELDARLEHLIRTKNLADSDVKISDEITFLPAINRVQAGSESILLRKKEGELLSYLIKNKNRAVSSEEILNNLYAYDEIRDDATLRTYIKNLRRILGKEKIQNIRGVGYLLELV